MATPSNRFNLIFHGMLGILQSPAGGWDVYVPIPQNCSSGVKHVAKWGLPKIDGTGLDGLEDVPNEDFTMDFKCDPPVSGPCEFDPIQMIVLRYLIPQAAKVWSKISIPAPTLMRVYRGIETTPGPDPDPNTLQALITQPRLNYEVVVFSYLNVQGDPPLKGRKGTVKKVKTSEETFNDFGIYYQALEQGVIQHGTAPFDNMFKVRLDGTDYPIRVGTLTSDAPTSTVPADGPPAPVATDSGIQALYMWSLSELNNRKLIQTDADRQALLASLLNRKRILIDGHVQCSGDPTTCAAVGGQYGT